MQRPQRKTGQRGRFLLSTLTRRAVGESVQRWLYGSRYDHRRRLYLQGERRAHLCCDAESFRDIVRSWRTGHWRGGMAMTRHYDRLAHRGLGFDRFGRGPLRSLALLHGFCDRGDVVSTGAATTGVVSTASGSTTTGSGSSVTGADSRRFDSRCFGDRRPEALARLAGADNFRSINDQRLGGRFHRLDDYRLSGRFHGSRLDGDRQR